MTDLVVEYVNGGYSVRPIEQLLSAGRPRSAGRAARSVRVGEDDVAVVPRRHPAARPPAASSSTTSTVTALDERELERYRRDEGRFRVPGLQPRSLRFGARERRRAAAAQRALAARRDSSTADGLLAPRRARRPAGHKPAAAVGRPAAARRDRPRADQRSDVAARRRADRQPRLHLRRGGHPSCCETCATTDGSSSCRPTTPGSSRSPTV